MATVIKLYIGHNVDGRPMTYAEREHAQAVILDRMSEAFVGFTLTEGKGVWRGARGLEFEDTTIAETVTEDGYDVGRFKAFAVAEQIRRDLRQEAVAVECHKCDFELVDGGEK